MNLQCNTRTFIIWTLEFCSTTYNLLLLEN